MTSPQPQPDDEPGISPAEDAVVDSLATFLLEVQLVASTAVPLYLLLRLGISKRAAQMTFRLARSPELPRLVRPRTDTALAQVNREEARIRARYLLGAAKRLAASLKLGGSPGAAWRAEQRHFQQHIDAARNRRRAARQVDRLAQNSPWMTWQTAADARVEADCRALAGRLFSVAQPPKLNGRTVWPGMVHPHCRCTAAPFGTTPHGRLAVVTATR